MLHLSFSLCSYHILPGVYECKAINENGDDSIYIKISVYGPPFINVKPRDTVGITGSDILVPCEATSEPVPVITWYRNERALTSDDADKYEFTEEGLKIKRAQAVDGGSFLCQVKISNLSHLLSLVIRFTYRVRNFRGRVSNFNQSEARKQCVLASDWLKFVTLPRKFRTLFFQLLQTCIDLLFKRHSKLFSRTILSCNHVTHN